jgi:hypothetical protein
MKTKFIVLFIVTSIIFIIGCAVKSDTVKAHQDPTIEEIKAIRNISFEANKTLAYTRIASRTDLNQTAQVHLVEAIFDNLSFDKSRSEVLLTLINNPSFCDAAETAILKRINNLSFENTRENILTAISVVKRLKSMKNSSSEQ